MTPKTNRAALATFLLWALPARALAAFDAPTLSAQSAAMGGASLAGNGDSSALFLNPAALSGLKRPETYLMYNRLYAGLEGVGDIGQGFAAFGLPTKLGDFGVGLSDFKASGLLEERILGLAFARRLGNALKAGIGVKFLHHRYLVGSDPAAAADPVFNNGASKGAPAVDIGAIASVTEALEVGLAVRNLNQPDLGLASEDRVPRELAVGAAYRLAPYALRLSGDFVYRAQTAGTLRDKSRPSFGLEKSFQGERVKVRAGFGLDQFTGGIGLQAGPVVFDYAFVLSRELLTETAGNHQVGIRYRFGGNAE